MEHAVHMTAKHVGIPILATKTVAAKFGALEIMHTTTHGRVRLGAVVISRESNY